MARNGLSCAVKKLLTHSLTHSLTTHSCEMWCVHEELYCLTLNLSFTCVYLDNVSIHKTEVEVADAAASK